MFSKALMMRRNSCWSLSEFRLQGIIMMARRILHGGCVQEMVQDTTVGVRPLRGLENDPATKGDTPDDRRADDIHLAEPKEITKEKAAKAQQEPPDFQGSKAMPGWDAPVHTDAKPQHTTIDPGLKKYHTWTKTGSRHFSTSTHSPVQETAEKDVAAMQLDQVRKWKVEKAGVTWVWWVAPKGFPNHTGVYRADPKLDNLSAGSTPA
ncbi:unnamed protein product [Sphagnum compactum]